MDSFLEIRNLSFSFGLKALFQGVGLRLMPLDSYVCRLGPQRGRKVDFAQNHRRAHFRRRENRPTAPQPTSRKSPPKRRRPPGNSRRWSNKSMDESGRSRVYWETSRRRRRNFPPHPGKCQADHGGKSGNCGKCQRHQPRCPGNHRRRQEGDPGTAGPGSPDPGNRRGRRSNRHRPSKSLADSKADFPAPERRSDRD